MFTTDLLWGSIFLKSITLNTVQCNSVHVVEYSVKQMEGLSVGLNGLGPLNWVGKKVNFACFVIFAISVFLDVVLLK